MSKCHCVVNFSDIQVLYTYILTFYINTFSTISGAGGLVGARRGGRGRGETSHRNKKTVGVTCN